MTLGFGMSPVLLEVAVTTSVPTWLLDPVVMPERLTVCKPALSLIVRLANGLRVGARYTAPETSAE